MRRETMTLHTRAATIALGLGVLLAAPVTAHDAHVVGAYRLEIGWGEEPAFAGTRNAVTVEVTAVAGGSPVTDLGGGSLSVEVTFGEQRVVLPMHANPERRNVFEAWIVPTRPGTYAFHVIGVIRNQPVDLRSTCSPTTFDCMLSAADLQFPTKDPSAGELSERIARSAPRADRAVDTATSARTFAGAALGLSGLALIVSIAAVRRKRGG